MVDDTEKTTTVAVSEEYKKGLFAIRHMLCEKNKKDVSYSDTIGFLIDFYNKNGVM